MPDDRASLFHRALAATSATTLRRSWSGYGRTERVCAGCGCRSEPWRRVLRSGTNLPGSRIHDAAPVRHEWVTVTGATGQDLVLLYLPGGDTSPYVAPPRECARHARFRTIHSHCTRTRAGRAALRATADFTAVHVGPSPIDFLSQKEEVPVTWRPLTTVGDDFFQTAAVSVTVTVDARVPVDRLWEVLSAEEAVVSWSPAVTEARWATTTRGVGAIREVTLGGILRVKEHFYRWDKNERMTFSAEAITLPGVRAFAEDYVVTSTSSGSQLEWTVAMEFTRHNSLLARVVRPILRFAVRDLARGLRRQAE